MCQVYIRTGGNKVIWPAGTTKTLLTHEAVYAQVPFIQSGRHLTRAHACVVLVGPALQWDVSRSSAETCLTWDLL